MPPSVCKSLQQSLAARQMWTRRGGPGTGFSTGPERWGTQQSCGVRVLNRRLLFREWFLNLPLESMEKGARNLLITGEPGIGKSTLAMKLVEELKALHPVGFYTDEIRVDGTRKGFQVISLDGRRSHLAHVDCRSPLIIGKYRVNVWAFEKFLDEIDLTGSDGRIVIIDEIGKMECMSRYFRMVVEELLEQERIVIATVAQNGTGMIETVKQREDVILFEMMRRNREEMLGKVLRSVQKIRFS